MPPTQKDIEMSSLLLDIIAPIVRVIRACMRDVPGSSLTVPQFRVLGYVSLNPCTKKQLADWQGVTLPAMSRMVDHLARRRFLITRRDTADRRQVQLALSEKGRAEFERLRALLRLKLAERIAPLAERDKQALEAGLVALKELFSDA